MVSVHFHLQAKVGKMSLGARAKNRVLLELFNVQTARNASQNTYFVIQVHQKNVFKNIFQRQISHR
jgi:hypothetical protein